MTQPLRDPSGPALVRWTIRLTDAEAKLIERAAKANGKSKTDWLRANGVFKAKRVARWLERKKPNKQSTRG